MTGAGAGDVAPGEDPVPCAPPGEPTATQPSALGQATAVKGGAPLGSDAVAHFLPPSVLSRARPEPADPAAVPTATQSEGEAQVVEDTLSMSPSRAAGHQVPPPSLLWRIRGTSLPVWPVYPLATQSEPLHPTAVSVPPSFHARRTPEAEGRDAGALAFAGAEPRAETGCLARVPFPDSPPTRPPTRAASRSTTRPATSRRRRWRRRASRMRSSVSSGGRSVEEGRVLVDMALL